MWPRCLRLERKTRHRLRCMHTIHTCLMLIFPVRVVHSNAIRTHSCILFIVRACMTPGPTAAPYYFWVSVSIFIGVSWTYRYPDGQTLFESGAHCMHLFHCVVPQYTVVIELYFVSLFWLSKFIFVDLFSRMFFCVEKKNACIFLLRCVESVSLTCWHVVISLQLFIYVRVLHFFARCVGLCFMHTSSCSLYLLIYTCMFVFCCVDLFLIYF